MRDIFHRSIKNIYRDNKDLCILDTGCGTGAIMRDLGEFGNVIGLDVKPKALEFCKQRRIEKILLSDGVTLPFKDRIFDLVTAFSVIEHIENDIGFIKEISRVCKDNGKVVISTSAFNFLWSEHDIVNEHKRRYTKRRLKGILNKHFVIEKITHTNCILFLFIWLGIILRNLLKGYSHQPSNGFYSLPKFMNKILTFILKTESVILQKINFPFGVSLLCIARKAKST